MLAELLHFPENHSDFQIIGSWFRQIDERGNCIGQASGYNDSAEKIAPFMLFHPALPTSTLLMDRACVEGLLFDESIAVASDFELWTRLVIKHHAWVLPKALARYRSHPTNITHRKAELANECLDRIYRNQLSRLGVTALAEDLALHRKLATLSLGTTRVTLQAAETWLLNLAEANDRVRMYPERAFREVLADRWYQVCQSGCHHGVWTWRRYIASPLARWNSSGRRSQCHLLRLAIRGTVKAMIFGRIA